MKYFAKIKYLGTDFHGFQVQPEERTVQGELCEALRQALGHPCKVTGCSRTDAGVHANEFCLTVECDGATVPAEKLPVAVARYLPNDLALYYAEGCSEDFHPRYDVREKEYLYRIVNSRIYDPFDFGRAWFFPRPIDAERLSRMRTAAEHFVGRHDFSAFMSEGSDTEDRVRTVTSLTVDMTGDLVEIRIRADGFLYNMVRILTGTLIEVGRGERLPEDIPGLFDASARAEVGYTAPAKGLTLMNVEY